MSEIAIPEAAEASWVDTMDAALDDLAALGEAMVRLHQLEASTTDTELLDVCRGARDLLWRWRVAQQAEDPCRADILLHDFRPVRPYARSLGEWITSRASVLRGEGTTGE